MANLFRKILIRLGKVIPFILAFFVLVGHIENIYSILTDRIAVDEYGLEYYYCPISTFLSDIVAIDVFDVILLYILSIALEFCWRNRLAIHYITLNLAVRFALETLSHDEWVILPLCSFMALFGLFCVYGGFKMIKYQKGKF